MYALKLLTRKRPKVLDLRRSQPFILSLSAPILMSEDELSDQAAAPQAEHKSPPKKSRPKMTRKEVEYARSRKKYLSRMSMSPTAILFSLDASTIKVGVANRGTQYKLERFADASQTDPIPVQSSGIQIPENERSSSRFPSLVHFLRAASSTVSALLDQSQFAFEKTEASPLSRMNKFTTETVPFQVEVTANRTYALLNDPAPLGRIAVWGARSQSISYHLISSASPSCFALYKDGRYVVAGTESGSILVWDISKTEKTKQSGVALILQPICSTDKQGNKNHRHAIVSVSVFGRSGAAVVAVLDASAVTSFWYIRNESTEMCLVKAEQVKLSTGFLPAYSLAMVPNSVNAFVVGCGGKIFNCCRFGSATSPAAFEASGAVKCIAFSPILTNIFAAAGDNGRVAVYDVAEARPLLELCVNMSLGETGVIWSPTRASVLFVSDVTGMRVAIYDLLVSPRTPVHVHKVGSAAQSLGIAKTASDVVLAIAEGGLAVNVFKVSDDLSKPLTEDQLNKFKVQLLTWSK